MSKLTVAGAAFAGICLVAIALPADAQMFGDPSVYASIGFSSSEASRINNDAATGRIGVRFGDYIGVEGELSTGLNEHRYYFGPHCPGPIVCPMFLGIGEARISNAEAGYVVGYWPLLPNADLFARAGYGGTNYAERFDEHIDNRGVAFGAGAQYFVDGANGLRFDFTRQEANGTNFIEKEVVGSGQNIWSIAFTHKF